MLGVHVIAYGAVAAVHGLLGPLRKLRIALELLAGAAETKQGEEPQLTTFDLLLTPEQLEELLNNPLVKTGRAEADLLKQAHAVPVCRHCGAVDYEQ